MTLLNSLLDLVFAPRCLGCDGAIAPADPARLVCRRCRSLLLPPPAPICTRCGAPRLQTGRSHGPRCLDCESWPPFVRSARSACLLREPAGRLVHQLKYRGWPALAQPMAALMAALPLPADVAAEARLVVPVPTTRSRRRERGYDQAELLAAAFARARGLRLATALERTTSTGSQTHLQPAARGANVARAFRARDACRDSVAGGHLLLVDDVLTTGATATECARALVEGGARCVSILTFARAPGARRLDIPDPEQQWPPA